MNLRRISAYSYTSSVTNHVIPPSAPPQALAHHFSGFVRKEQQSRATASRSSFAAAHYAAVRLGESGTHFKNHSRTGKAKPILGGRGSSVVGNREWGRIERQWVQAPAITGGAWKGACKDRSIWQSQR